MAKTAAVAALVAAPGKVKIAPEAAEKVRAWRVLDKEATRVKAIVDPVTEKKVSTLISGLAGKERDARKEAFLALGGRPCIGEVDGVPFKVSVNPVANPQDDRYEVFYRAITAWLAEAEGQITRARVEEQLVKLLPAPKPRLDISID